MADARGPDPVAQSGDTLPGGIGGGAAPHQKPLVSRHPTDPRATQIQDSLNRLTLHNFDESTWKRMEESKESRSFFPAVFELARALYDFIEAAPGSKWHSQRVEFERLISRLDYVKAYKEGYDR